MGSCCEKGSVSIGIVWRWLVGMEERRKVVAGAGRIESLADEKRQTRRGERCLWPGEEKRGGTRLRGGGCRMGLMALLWL